MEYEGYLDWKPVKAKGICIFLHDFNAGPSRFSALAEKLRSQAVLGVAPELFPAAKVPQHRFKLNNIYIIINTLLTEIMTKYSGLPVFLCGEGFGAIMAVRFAQKYPDRIAGVVLMSPFFDIPVDFKTKVKIWLDYFIHPGQTHELTMKLSMLTKNDRCEAALSLQESQKYFYSAELLADYLRAAQAVRSDHHRLQAATLCLLAADDLLAENTLTLKFFEELTVEDKNMSCFEEFHALSLPENPQQVFECIAGWVSSRLAY